MAKKMYVLYRIKNNEIVMYSDEKQEYNDTILNMVKVDILDIDKLSDNRCKPYFRNNKIDFR